MDKVFVVEGWFGADEWTEKIFAKEEDAEACCTELWIERKSETNPGHICNDYGLCKFAVIERAVY